MSSGPITKRILFQGWTPLRREIQRRLSTVICFDADFPTLMWGAGSKRVDVMLVPSEDWQAADPWHTQHATFRAIENGYSLVRQASHSLAMTVDYQGRVLASTDYFTTDQQTMIAYVPIQGVWTIYSVVGDLFAWLCLAGVGVLAGLVAFLSYRRRLPRPEALAQSTVEAAHNY